MQIRVTVVNVMEQRVPSSIGYLASRVTGEDPTGTAMAETGETVVSLPDDTCAIALTVNPNAYHPDLVRLRKAGPKSEWLYDNPAASLTPVPDGLEVRLTVGRLRAAPTVVIPDKDLPKIKGPPPGVLLYGTPHGLIYHSLYWDVYPFIRLDHPALKESLPENAKLWERMRSTKVNKIDPAREGTYFHLEYGDRILGPRLLLSVFLPHSASRKVLDVAVFLSPTTALKDRFPRDTWPFRRNYPYGLTERSQEYPRHGQAYLFNNSHLAYQFLAAGSSAAVVMPIAPYGDWSIFQTRSGLHRLVKEISLFLHREMLTTSERLPRPVSEYNVHAGGSVRDLTGLGMGVGVAVFAHWSSPLPLGRVAVSAFSTGCIPLQALLTDTEGKLPSNYDARYFAGNIDAFNEIFAEVWDIDCAHHRYGGYPAFETALAAWMKPGKRFRLYHSQETGGDRDSMTQPALAPLTKESDIVHSPTVKEQGVTLWAHERYAANNDWSVLRFANAFLSSRDGGTSNPYWMMDDTHHFLPKIAFGHAALLFAASDGK